MEERLDITFRKQQTQFRKDSRIKECFHYDSASCTKNIVSAHSLQKSGVLDLIEDDVEGNLVVYSFLDLKYDTEGNVIGFESLGKKAASTFFGFCDYHDNSVFAEIENNPIDLDNDEHCFLLSYRAFAKDFHAKQETLQGYKSNEMFQRPEMIEIRDKMISGSETGLKDCTVIKNKLNTLLQNNEYDSLEYFTCELDYVVPIALAASINPQFTFDNIQLNVSPDPNVPWEFVNFLIQPTKEGKTLILLSCLSDQEKSIRYIDSICNLKTQLLTEVITSIAIAHVENTFFSPQIWNELKHFEKKQLIKELHLTSPMGKTRYKRFFRSELNLLSKRFSKTN